MKILTNKKYEDLLQEIDVYKHLWENPKQELTKAKDFKKIMERITDKHDWTISLNGGSYTMSYDPLSQSEITLKPDENNSMTFVADELSENEVIIKQKSTPVVILNKDGEVKKKGFTKQKADKGYTYKLVRE